MKSFLGWLILIVLGVVAVLLPLSDFGCFKQSSNINSQPIVQKYSVGQIVKMKIDCRKCQILYPGFFSGWVIRCVSLNTQSNYTEINVSEIEIEEIK